jgi:hypothetical protein
MAVENPSWGEGHIADELSLKPGILVDSRTVGNTLSKAGDPGSRLDNDGVHSFAIMPMQLSLAISSRQ